MDKFQLVARPTQVNVNGILQRVIILKKVYSLDPSTHSSHQQVHQPISVLTQNYGRLDAIENLSPSCVGKSPKKQKSNNVQAPSTLTLYQQGHQSISVSTQNPSPLVAIENLPPSCAVKSPKKIQVRSDPLLISSQLKMRQTLALVKTRTPDQPELSEDTGTDPVVNEGESNGTFVALNRIQPLGQLKARTPDHLELSEDTGTDPVDNEGESNGTCVALDRVPSSDGNLSDCFEGSKDHELHEKGTEPSLIEKSDASKKKQVLPDKQSCISHPFLKDILPPEYNYILKSLKEIESPFKKWNQVAFIAIIRANIDTKEKALQWRTDFENLTMCNFRLGSGQNNTPRLVFKKTFRCHSNTRASEPNSKTKVPHKKHYDCKSVLIITVKNKNMPRSTDKFLQEYPCEIYLKHIHNHRIKCADATRFRKPGKDLIKYFLNLFHRGHSASSALHCLKHDLQEKFGLRYHKVAADGERRPSINWVYNIYYNHFTDVYGPPNGEEMEKALRKG